jgi:hypothetical protein
MYDRVDTSSPSEVEKAVRQFFLDIYPDCDAAEVTRLFDWAHTAFTGAYRDFQAVDTRYHDYEHTLQVVLCLGRLLHARHLARTEPRLSQRIFTLGLLASLLHDSGYLKNRDDRQGTGAKYTDTHVERSADFAATLMQDKGYAPADIQAVQNMIRCTDFFRDLKRITFAGGEEQMAGLALATADLLGQMAAEDYVEKLPLLFSEFKEAGGNDTAFTSARDLMRKTPAFYESFVKIKIDRDYGGLYRYLNDPYPDGPNFYIDAIEANLKRLEQKLASKRAAS